MKKIRTMRSLLRTISPNCRDVAESLSRSLDEPQPAAVRLGMKIHLLLCRWCRRYQRQLRFMRSEVREGESHWAECSGRHLPADARKRMKELLRRPNSS